MFSCTHWVSTKFRVNSRNFGFTQTWENNITKVLLKLLHVPNKRETWLPCFEIHSKIHSNVTFEWYEDDMVFRVFVVIIFRTNGKKGQLDAKNFRHYYGNFFRRWHSESYLITAMFKISSQQLRSTLTITSWKVAYSSIFYGHGLTHVLNLSSRPR